MRPLDPDLPAGSELELGYVSGVFGFRGEVRLFLHNRESTWLREPREVTLLTPGGERFAARLVARPGAGKRVLGRIDGVDSHERATELIGARVCVAPEALPEAEDGAYYVWQVLGIAVVIGDAVVGRVVEVHATGPHEVFELEIDGETRFVPSLPEFVEDVDVAGRRLVLRPDALGAD